MCGHTHVRIHMYDMHVHIYPKFSEPSWPFSCCFCQSQKPWVSGCHCSERKGTVWVEVSLGRPGWQSFLWLYRAWGFWFWPLHEEQEPSQVWHFLLRLLTPVASDMCGGTVNCEETAELGGSRFTWYVVTRVRGLRSAPHSGVGSSRPRGYSSRAEPGPRAGAGCSRDESEEPQVRGLGCDVPLDQVISLGPCLAWHLPLEGSSPWPLSMESVLTLVFAAPSAQHVNS